MGNNDELAKKIAEENINAQQKAYRRQYKRKWAISLSGLTIITALFYGTNNSLFAIFLIGAIILWVKSKR